MRLSEKIARILLVTSFLLYNTPIKSVSASTSFPFSGFDQELVTMDPAYWDLSSVIISDNKLQATDLLASSSYNVNISSLAGGIDQGGLEIEFSAGAYIASEAVEELDLASITIGFGSSSDAPSSTTVLTRGVDSPDSISTLSSNASIPVGTRFIFIQPSSIGNGVQNTTVFSSLSLRIRDLQNPTLSYEIDPTGWTNGDVQVTVTASDDDSGIEGIYDSENVKVSSAATHSFLTSTNGSWVFTSKDYAGKTSDELTVSVTGIDIHSPAKPTLTVVSSEWSNQQVGFTISESTPGAGEAPESRQYRLNGGEWQVYAEPAYVDVEGESTLEARIIDEAENASEFASAAVKIDLSFPTITLSSEVHTYPASGATITASISDTISELVATKYAAGSQTADFFLSGGTDLTAPTIEIATSGIYTFYAVDRAGNTTIEEIDVNTPPSMDDIADQTMAEDSPVGVNFAVTDDQTAANDLVVTAESSNLDLFPGLTPVNTNGAVSLVLSPAANQYGSAQVTVGVRDGTGQVSSQIFSVTVSSSNDEPTAEPDSAITDEDTPVVIDVLSNDSDVDTGDALKITGTGGAPNGTVDIITDGTKIRFTPSNNSSGSTSFTYTIEDNAHSTASATVTVMVNPVDDAPLITGLTDQTIDEDGNTGLLNFSVTDPEGDSLSISSTSSNISLVPDDNITVTNLGSGNYTLVVVPVGELSGAATITISANDGVKTSTGSFLLTVNAVNDVPVAGIDTASTDEDTPVVIGVLANDTDVEHEALTVIGKSSPSHGTVLITDDGTTVTYSPAADFNGSDSFEYTVQDTAGGTATGTVNIAVNSINDVPYAVDDSVNTDEDTLITVQPLINDGDVDIALNSDAIVITEVTGELHGTVVLAGDGLSFTYTPATNSVDTEHLSYTIRDTDSHTATAVVTISINSINDTPAAGNDLAETNEDTPVVVNVLENDSDVDTAHEGDTLTVCSVGTVTNGSAAIINANTQIRFIPDANWNSSTSFTYTICDKENLTSSASVTVTVNPVNDAPVISVVADQTIDEDFSTGDVVFTVSDAESNPLLVTAAGNNDELIPASSIVVTDNGSGNYSINLTPVENINGTALVTLTAADGTDTTTRTFNFTVNTVNDAPVANPDAVSTNEDTALEVSVLTNDTDVENEELTVTAVGLAGHGNTAITGSGKTVTFTPNTNYNGPDTFTYTIKDATGATVTGTVNVTVNTVNDAPSATADSASLNEDIVTTIDVLANDIDIDLTTNPTYETLTVVLASDPPHGTTSISENKVVYTPDANYFGTDSFTYTLQDTDGLQSTATVSLTVKSVNDYPVFTNLQESYTVNEDESITFHFNISDTETTTESLMLQVVSQNQSVVPDSKLVLDGLGDANTDTTLTITPNLNQNQDVIIKFTLGDGFVTTQENFILDITPVNDPPVTVNDSYSFTEDNSITIDMDDLAANDTDIDNDTLSFVEVVPGSLGTGTLTELDIAAHTYTYTPPVNFDGSTTFVYTMTDGTVQQNGTVTLAAHPVNDAPILTLDGGNPSSFDEDNPATLHFTIADYETAISNLAVQAGSSNSDLISPDNIVITRNPDGTCSMQLTPGEDQNGTVTISLSLSDGVILVQQDIPLTINPIYDNPVAANDSLTVESGGTITFSPLENDHDADKDIIAIQSLDKTGTQGSVVDNGDGTLTYIAPSGSTGSDSFSYTINDGLGHTDSAVVSITITGGNTPPQITGVADQFINEDISTAELSFSVSDADTGSTLTVTKSSSDETLIPLDNIVISATGINTYKVVVSPAANQSGTAVITLTVTDEKFAANSTSFTMTVYPINDQPLAVDDSYSINEDNTLTITGANLLSNDIDVDEGAVLQITNITDPAHGRLTFDAGSGQYSYRPDGNYTGSDSFEYIMTDGITTDTALVNITMLAVNDNPVAYSNWWTLTGSAGATMNGDIRTNDYDIETADANLVVTILTQPAYGTAVVEANGTVTYTRSSSSNSPDWKDSFTYNVSDDNVPAGVSNTATVYIDDYWGPSIYGDDQWFSMDEDHGINTTLAIHDGFGEGYTVSISSPTLGTITDLNATDANITYTPNANVFGTETINYTLVSNSSGNPTGSGKFYITIYPINDAPEISPALSDVTINEDSSTSTLHVDISDVETSAEDLIFTASSSNSSLVLDSGISINRTGGSIDFVISPIANRYGNAIITLLTSDSVAQTVLSFNLTVNPVNDVPVADDLNAATNEDTPVTITVVSPNADLDGDTLTVTATVNPEHGSLTINGDNTITYSPILNYYGPDSFTYQLADASASDTGVVSLTVNPINDPPDISNLVYNQNTLEDTPKVVTFKISDVDNSLTPASVTVVPANTTILPSGSITVGGSGTDISVTLSPAANLSGTSIQTVTVTDGTYSASQDFKLTVAAVNDIPVANTDTAITDEDIPAMFNVIANDTDIEIGTLTVVSFVDPPHGSVVNNRDGTLTYTPDENWNGTDSFNYTIADVNNGQSTSLVTITVNPVNDAPITHNDSATILEDNPVTLNLLANDSDIEGSTLSLTGVSDPLKGTYLDNGDGSITYTPNTNQNGLDTFTYTVSDGELTSTGTVSIQITAINDAPQFSTSVDLPWTLYEDTPKSFPITITDPETASDNLVAKITSSDQTLVPDTSIELTGSGQNKFLKLSPLLNKFGTLDLTIEVSDGVHTTTDIYPVQVISVNDLPTISAIANQTTPEDTATAALSFTLSDIETPPADLTVTAASADGTLIPAENVVVTKGTGGNRTVVLTPASNKVGSSLITLTVHDADGGTADESLTLTVTAVNDGPVAVANTASVNEDDQVTIDVLANDVDADLLNEGDNLTIVSTTGVDNATVTIATDKKSLTFKPNANWNGTEIFNYTMKDNAGITSSASVTVTVSAVNDPPAASNDTATTSEDTPVSISVLANDTDIDLAREGDTLTILSTANVDNGSITIAGDNKSLTFTPFANWNGTEVFTYTVTDTHNTTSTAQVTVTVNAVNDAPVISDITDQTLTEDTSSPAISFTVSDVESAAGDLIVTAATGDNTRITVGGVVFGGTSGNRTLTITPLLNKNTWKQLTSTHQPITLTITVSDGSLTSNDSFAVTINPVNDAPAAVNDSATTNEDVAKEISVLTNDSDVDIANEGDVLTVTEISGVDNGSALITGSGKTITFTPNSDYYGSETFTYTIQDSFGLSASANVTINVSAVNDAPFISDVADQTTNEDTSTGELSFTISDVDNSLTCANVTAVSGTTAIIPSANLVIAGSGTNCSVTVTPQANKNTSGSSPVTISLSVSDGLLSRSDTFTVTVLPINDPPNALNDVTTVVEDHSVDIDVLDNDEDADLTNEGDTQIVLSTAGVDHGTVAIDPSTYVLTFTPEANWLGVETFTYTMEDGAHVSSTASVMVTVTAENDPPIASDDTATVVEDGSTSILVLSNDSDIDISREGDSLSVYSYSEVDHGTVTIASDSKSVTFSPEPNWAGVEIFAYTIRDSANSESTAHVTVTVTGVNDPPLAKNDSYTSLEDQTAALDVLANDVDIDLAYEGDDLIILSVNGALHGTANVAADQKSISYFPELNWRGTENLTYTMEDKDHRVSSASITLQITPVNDPPEAVPDGGTTQEDSDITLNVLTNDVDVDISREGDALKIISTSGVDHGTVTIASGGQSLTFDPADNWNGTEEFTYTMEDNANASSVATVSVTVTPINDFPDAVDDSDTTQEDQDIVISVLGNDTDVDLLYEGDTLQITGISGVDHGTAEISTDHTTITFKPAANWNGTESFSYAIKDKSGESDSAVVTLVVTSVNDAPAAVADSYTIDEDAATTLNVLENDKDDDPGDPLLITDVSGVNNASVTVATDKRSLSFTPDLNWNGTEQFTYTITDSGGDSSSAEVTVQGTPVNDSPAAADDTATVDEDQSVTIDVLVNDSDVDISREGDSLTLFEVNSLDHGTYSFVNSNHSILFSPSPDWNGVEIFTYTVSDSHGAKSTATVTVTVDPQEDSSTAVADSAGCQEDENIQIEVLENDIDADLAYGGDNLTVVSITDVDHGSATIDTGSKSLTFVPAANWNGTEVFSYTMQDAHGYVSTALVTVIVSPKNDAPAAVADATSTDEDVPVIIDVLHNDTDVDLSMEGDNLLITSISGTYNGYVNIATDGKSLTYDPPADYFGSETFTYTMGDKAAITSSASVVVTIKAVDDAPIVSTITDQTISEDTITGPIAFTLSDIDSLADDIVVAATSSNLAVVSNSSMIIDGSGASRTVSITPVLNKNTFGTDPVTITLRASSSVIAVGTAIFKLTITPVNDNPQAVGDVASMNEDTSITLNPLNNDTDVDLLNEGDDLTITGVTDVNNGTAQITNGGKNILFTPNSNWYGVEEFNYSMQDKPGVQSSASIFVSVADVAEYTPKPDSDSDADSDEDSDSGSGSGSNFPPVYIPVTRPGQLSFKVLSPYFGSEYKDGQEIRVSWTSLPISDVVYSLEFFDGKEWATLANGLTSTSFKHKLGITHLHTDTAFYKVTALMGSTDISAESQLVTIDNVPPRGIRNVVSTSDGKPYSIGTSSGQPVIITEDGGWDLTGIKIRILDNGIEIASGDSQSSAPISTPGTHQIQIIAVDPLGNLTIISEYTITIASEVGEKSDTTSGSAKSEDDRLFSSGGNDVFFPPVGWIGAAILLGILLLFLFGPNVKITYSLHRPDGSQYKAVHYKRIFSSRDREITLDVKSADAYEVEFGRWLTRDNRGGNLTIRVDKQPDKYVNIIIPKDVKNRFKTFF